MVRRTLGYLTAGAFLLCAMSLRADDTDIHITEILYRADPTNLGGEFVEIHNRGTQAIDVGGWVIMLRGMFVGDVEPFMCRSACDVSGEGAIDVTTRSTSWRSCSWAPARRRRLSVAEPHRPRRTSSSAARRLPPHAESPPGAEMPGTRRYSVVMSELPPVMLYVSPGEGGFTRDFFWDERK